jgi:hypothetical protein
MKYNQLDKLVEHSPVLLDVLGLSEFKVEHYETATLHKLYFMLYSNLNYPNDNPNVMNKQGGSLVENGGERMLSLDESFELYPNDCTDDNIASVMRRAIKQILKSKNYTPIR